MSMLRRLNGQQIIRIISMYLHHPDLSRRNLGGINTDDENELTFNHFKADSWKILLDICMVNQFLLRH